MTSIIDQRIASFFPCGSVVVDLGCGAGEILDYAIKFCDVAVGLDISTNRLHKKTNAPTAWKFICSDLNRPFPLKDGIVDTVFANQVIEHISDPLFFATEIHRVLLPGGNAIVTSPNIRYVKHIWRLMVKGLGPSTANGNTLDGKWDDGHIHYFTHNDLRQIFMDAGFKQISSKALIDLTGKMIPIRTLFDHFSEAFLVREFASGNIMLLAEK